MQPKMQSNTTHQPRQIHKSGIVVRSGLRAGLAWDDLDDQAKEWWNSLTSAISNAADTVKNSVSSSQS